MGERMFIMKNFNDEAFKLNGIIINRMERIDDFIRDVRIFLGNKKIYAEENPKKEPVYFVDKLYLTKCAMAEEYEDILSAGIEGYSDALKIPRTPQKVSPEKKSRLKSYKYAVCDLCFESEKKNLLIEFSGPAELSDYQRGKKKKAVEEEVIVKDRFVVTELDSNLEFNRAYVAYVDHGMSDTEKFEFDDMEEPSDTVRYYIDSHDARLIEEKVDRKKKYPIIQLEPDKDQFKFTMIDLAEYCFESRVHNDTDFVGTISEKSPAPQRDEQRWRFFAYLSIVLAQEALSALEGDIDFERYNKTDRRRIADTLFEDAVTVLDHAREIEISLCREIPGESYLQKGQQDKWLKSQKAFTMAVARKRPTDPLRLLTIRLAEKLFRRKPYLGVGDIATMISGAIAVLAEKNNIDFSLDSENRMIEKWVSMAKENPFEKASFSVFKEY